MKSIHTIKSLIGLCLLVIALLLQRSMAAESDPYHSSDIVRQCFRDIGMNVNETLYWMNKGKYSLDILNAAEQCGHPNNRMKVAEAFAAPKQPKPTEEMKQNHPNISLTPKSYSTLATYPYYINIYIVQTILTYIFSKPY